MLETEWKQEKSTQHVRIIRMLKRAGSTGVPNYDFARVGILSFTKRISELRHDGWNILMERQWINGKATGTFYYILREDKDSF